MVKKTNKDIVKILLLPDLHGELDKKFEKYFNNVEFVVSVGDFINDKKYRKIIKKYLKELELYEAKKIKKEPVLDLEKKVNLKEDIKDLKNLFNKLNKFNKKIFYVLGNWETLLLQKVFSGIKIEEYKNLILLDDNFLLTEDFFIIGQNYLNYGENLYSSNNLFKTKKENTFLTKLTLNYEIIYQFNIITSLFLEYKEFSSVEPNIPLIYISHTPPFNTKLDVTNSKKNVGSKFVKKMIEMFQPSVFISGHIHESKGFEYIGKTLCINTGYKKDGGYILIYNKKTNKFDLEEI